MKKLASSLLAAGLILALAGCSQVAQNMRDDSARLDEVHLKDAGFRLVLADNQHIQDALNTLPAFRISRMTKDGVAYYIYPDPDDCVCVYVGRDEEYQRLQQLGVERQLSDQQLMVNDMKQEAYSGYGYYGMWNSWMNNNPGRPDWDPH